MQHYHTRGRGTIQKVTYALEQSERFNATVRKDILVKCYDKSLGKLRVGRYNRRLGPVLGRGRCSGISFLLSKPGALTLDCYLLACFLNVSL